MVSPRETSFISGLTSCDTDTCGKPIHDEARKLRSEWVISVTGSVTARATEVINPKLPTGEIEVRVKTLDVLSMSPLLMEKYLEAAENVVARAVPGAAENPPDTKGGADRNARTRNEKRIYIDGPPPEDADARLAYARKILASFATVVW